MSTEVVTEALRDRIWGEMADVGRYLQYYERLANQCLRRDRALRFVLFVGAGVGVGALSGTLPFAQWFGLGSAFALLVATAVSFVFDWGVRGAFASAIHGECHLVNIEYIALWTAIRSEQVSEHEADTKSRELLTRLAVVTTQLPGSDSKLNREAQRAGYRILAERWNKTTNGRARTERATTGTTGKD